MTLSIAYQRIMMRYMNEIQRALQEASSSACVSTLHSVLATWEIRSKNQNVYAKIGGVKKL